MITLDHSEAVLFRMLASFFGQDNVIPHMSVSAVCGPYVKTTEAAWAKKTKCLFTVVDKQDEPKLVVEFFSGFDKPFRPEDEEHQRILKPLLERSGIAYITISNEELNEIMDPHEPIDFFHWLKYKYEDLVAILPPKE